MNWLNKALLNTRKSVLETCTQNGYNYPNDTEISLISCTNCGLWLWPDKMKKDDDDLDICKVCLDYYGR